MTRYYIAVAAVQQQEGLLVGETSFFAALLIVGCVGSSWLRNGQVAMTALA